MVEIVVPREIVSRGDRGVAMTIAALFVPDVDPRIGTLVGYAVGFLARPFGGALFRETENELLRE